MYYKALANDYHQEFLSQQAFNTLAKRAYFLQVSVQQILQKRNSSMWYKQNGSILLKVLYFERWDLGYDSYCCNFGILNIYTIMFPQFKRAHQFHFEAEGFWWSRSVSNSSFHSLKDNDLDFSVATSWRRRIAISICFKGGKFQWVFKWRSSSELIPGSWKG